MSLSGAEISPYHPTFNSLRPPEITKNGRRSQNVGDRSDIFTHMDTHMKILSQRKMDSINSR